MHAEYIVVYERVSFKHLYPKIPLVRPQKKNSSRPIPSLNRWETEARELPCNLVKSYSSVMTASETLPLCRPT